MRSNWLWPLLLIGVAGYWGLQAGGVLSAPVTDLAGRAWPILLVIAGLSAMISRRVRYANLIVLAVGVVLTAGVIGIAYTQQAGKLRTDYRETFAQTLPDSAKTTRISLAMLLTQITIEPTDGRTLSAEFVGSSESKFTADYHVDASGIATITLTETRPAAIPLLDRIGRGTLTLRLPIGLPIDDLTIKNSGGALALDATGATVRNLNIALGGGDITVNLPNLAAQDALGGSIHTSSGDLTISVPSGLSLKLTIDSGKPVFNAADYLLLSGGVLQSAGTRDFQAVLAAGASGSVTLK